MTLPRFRCEDAAHIVALAREAGACAAGFTAIEPVGETDNGLYRKWLADGRHGPLEYMERHNELRSDPRMLLDDACTMLCCAFSYAPADDADRHSLFADYARGEDYHKVLRRRLKPVARAMEALVPDSRTRICADTAPLRERYWAIRAGLGGIGLNGQLLVPGAGSKIFLAEILWTAAGDIPEHTGTSPCTGCGACVRACPVAALDGKGGVDARRCLSCITIEYHGELPAGLRLPGRIYGCDICADACPANRTPAPALPEFRLSPALAALDSAALAGMTQQQYDDIFAHSAIRRAPLPQLLRNLRHKP